MAKPIEQRPHGDQLEARGEELGECEQQGGAWVRRLTLERRLRVVIEQPHSTPVYFQTAQRALQRAPAQRDEQERPERL
jgi:hypothetical protein